MKVFLPVTDSLLAEYGATQLVPIDPNFLIPSENEGRKPSTWITDEEYLSARERLRRSRVIPL